MSVPELPHRLVDTCQDDPGTWRLQSPLRSRWQSQARGSFHTQMGTGISRAGPGPEEIPEGWKAWGHAGPQRSLSQSPWGRAHGWVPADLEWSRLRPQWHTCDLPIVPVQALCQIPRGQDLGPLGGSLANRQELVTKEGAPSSLSGPRDARARKGTSSSQACGRRQWSHSCLPLQLQGEAMRSEDAQPQP